MSERDSKVRREIIIFSVCSKWFLIAGRDVVRVRLFRERRGYGREIILLVSAAAAVSSANVLYAVRRRGI